MTASSRITRFEGGCQRKAVHFLYSLKGSSSWEASVEMCGFGWPLGCRRELVERGLAGDQEPQDSSSSGEGLLWPAPFFCLSLSRFNTTREKVSQVTFFLTPWFCNFFMNRCGNFISNSKIWDFPRHNHCEFSGCSPPLSHKLGVLRRWWEPMRR